MVQAFQIRSDDDMICKFCGSAMRLFGIEHDAESEGVLLRSYECPHCKSLQTGTAVQTELDGNGFFNPIFALAYESGFDDAALTLLGSAFESAWSLIDRSGAPLADDPEPARERLAKCVIAQGIKGERNEARIVQRALAALMSQVNGPDIPKQKFVQNAARI